jgi:hypothetical protein
MSGSTQEVMIVETSALGFKQYLLEAEQVNKTLEWKAS